MAPLWDHLISHLRFFYMCITLFVVNSFNSILEASCCETARPCQTRHSFFLLGLKIPTHRWSLPACAAPTQIRSFWSLGQHSIMAYHRLALLNPSTPGLAVVYGVAANVSMNHGIRVPNLNVRPIFFMIATTHHNCIPPSPSFINNNDVTWTTTVININDCRRGPIFIMTSTDSH